MTSPGNVKKRLTTGDTGKTQGRHRERTTIFDGSLIMSEVFTPFSRGDYAKQGILGIAIKDVPGSCNFPVFPVTTPCPPW